MIERCEACTKAFVLDHVGDLVQACDCSTCARCGNVFVKGDEGEPHVAESDLLAVEHDPTDQGMCEDCWTEVQEEDE